MEDWERSRFEISRAGAARWTRPVLPIGWIEAVHRERLVAVLGEPIAEADDLAPGLGELALWGVRWPCRCEAVLSWRHPMWPGDRLGAEIRANDPAVDHALHHVSSLGLAPITWRIAPADTPQPVDPWVVLRQDDNGQRFVVREVGSRFAAECVRRRFEAAGHKQLYWVEPAAHQP